MRTVLGIAAIACLLLAAMRPSQAQTYTVLHAFTTGGDGANPRGALVRDSSGDLYGTTLSGGTSGYGTVFKLSRSGEETVLYSFKGGSDGQGPTGKIQAADGNLYGSTYAGGPSGAGIVFMVNKAGKETALYSFCSQSKCSDGDSPNGGVIRDANGNLYGTTYSGGAYNGGTVFMLSKAGKERVLYTFCSQSGCADGGGPLAGLIQDTKGNFYGTTSGGGAYGGGVVFKLNTTGEETVLYSFCSQRGCDGVAPIAGVIRDRIGNLYGTTSGYQSNCQGSGCGVVFKLSKSGKEAALHSFTGGADGGEPFESGVIRDAAGNLYGTTLIGGASNIGVLFELSKGGKETVLYNFCSQSKCSDGASPNVGVIRDSKGNLYGTTYYGGDPACGESGVGCGVVFKLTP